MIEILDCLHLQEPVIDMENVNQLLDSTSKLQDLEDLSSVVQNFRLSKPEIYITNPHHKVNTILSSWDAHARALEGALGIILPELLELKNYNVLSRSEQYGKIQACIKSSLDNVGKIEDKLSALTNANVTGLEKHYDQVSILKWFLQFIQANIALDSEDYNGACKIFCILTNPDNTGFKVVKQFLNNPISISSDALLQTMDRGFLDAILEKVEGYKIEAYTRAFISSSEDNTPKMRYIMSEYLERSFAVMKSTADRLQSGNDVNPKLYKPLLDSLSLNAGSEIALDMGREMIRLGDYDNALECLNIASRNPGLTDVNRLNILYNLSIVYLHKGNYQQIRNDTFSYSGSISDAVSSTYGYLLCARSYAYDMLGGKVEAIENLIKAVDYVSLGDSIYQYISEKFVEFADKLLDLKCVYGIEKIKELATSWMSKLGINDTKIFPKFDDVTKEEISSAADVGSLQIILYEQIYAEVISSFRQECYKGNLEGIKSLINNNKSILGFSKLVNSPQTLFYVINGIATSQEKKEIMFYLKEENLLDLNINNGFALEIAVQKNDLYLVQFLMNNSVKMPSDDHEDAILLLHAAQKNNYDMFFFLKNKGIKVDDEFLQDISSLELSGDLEIPNNWLHEYV